MITSNTSIPFIKAENSENKFYLSRLTSEYNEGDSITTSTDINCRKLAIALKAGDKITINGTSLSIASIIALRPYILVSFSIMQKYTLHMISSVIKQKSGLINKSAFN